MGFIHFFTHHVWWFIAAAGMSAILALLFHKQTKRILRICKALATDPRLPRPVRWLFGVALVAKCLPIDFGIDEAALVLGAVLLLGPYRHVWREIRHEIQ